MILNGKEVELDSEITVEDLLNKYKLNPKKVVVEVNRKIIAQNDYRTIKLKSNDSVEVISFVGGG